MALAWESPFLVISNEAPGKVRSRGKEVVRWTKERLLKDFFAEAPTQLEEVWIFKDAASYTQSSRKIFKIDPNKQWSDWERFVVSLGPGA